MLGLKILTDQQMRVNRRDAVLARVRRGDVVVTMGAGSIGMLAAELSVAAVVTARVVGKAART